jgi:hypothetical protein
VNHQPEAICALPPGSVVAVARAGSVVQARLVRSRFRSFVVRVEGWSGGGVELRWRDEGVTWARGWDTPEAKALRAEALLLKD